MTPTTLLLLKNLTPTQKNYVLSKLNSKEKNTSTAYICWFLFGVHQFYLGQPMKNILDVYKRQMYQRQSLHYALSAHRLNHSLPMPASATDCQVQAKPYTYPVPLLSLIHIQMCIRDRYRRSRFNFLLHLQCYFVHNSTHFGDYAVYLVTVSYTHLDVYKRQFLYCSPAGLFLLREWQVAAA